MRIAFYAPLKPLDHPNPSGDVMIARSIASYLKEQGHEVLVGSRVRARWIYWNPRLLALALKERYRLTSQLARRPVDLWFTSHSYYKAPDIIGAPLCQRLNIPYVIFQGSYATKYRRSWKTRPGFRLNRKALLTADLLLSNRRHDMHDLARIVKKEKLVYFRPGIRTDLFRRNTVTGRKLRHQWHAEKRSVLLTAAMFRSDVKSHGIAEVIASCHRLQQRGYRFLLVIAGDGPEKQRLQRLARRLPEDAVHFTGKISHEQMPAFYSAGDLFVFPGFRESLGMVFLEAQACGLPVVAYANGGIPEVVNSGTTGLLCPLDDRQALDDAVAGLLDNPRKRSTMGEAAARLVCERHDLASNYQVLEKALIRLVNQRPQQENQK